MMENEDLWNRINRLIDTPLTESREKRLADQFIQGPQYPHLRDLVERLGDQVELPSTQERLANYFTQYGITLPHKSWELVIEHAKQEIQKKRDQEEFARIMNPTRPEGIVEVPYIGIGAPRPAFPVNASVEERTSWILAWHVKTYRYGCLLEWPMEGLERILRHQGIELSEDVLRLNVRHAWKQQRQVDFEARMLRCQPRNLSELALEFLYCYPADSIENLTQLVQLQQKYVPRFDGDLMGTVRSQSTQLQAVLADSIYIRALPLSPFVIDTFSGNEFTDVIDFILRSAGYTTLEKKGSREGGTDLLAERWQKLWNLQCKNQEEHVRRNAVSDVTGTKIPRKADYSAVVVNTYFRMSAYAIALPNGVYMYDRESIDGWIREYCRGISSSMILKAVQEKNSLGAFSPEFIRYLKEMREKRIPGPWN